jgi:predicted HAD superfamily Cof-like phosphohydrolase
VTDEFSRMVREFHEAFERPVRDMPGVGTPEERVLRVRLMLEEVLEFAKAANVRVAFMGSNITSIEHLRVYYVPFGAPDLTAMAHELADVQYVTSGTAVQLGIPLLPVVAEVHAANMRKLGPDGKSVVDELGKVRKPPGWRPADVGAVLKRLNEGEE